MANSNKPLSSDEAEEKIIQDPWNNDQLYEEIAEKFIKQKSSYSRKILELKLKLKRFVWKAVIASSYFLKRALDLCASVPAVLILSPVYIITWLAIIIEDPGPAIFKQQRVGRFGRVFTIYKFRSMVMNADKLKYELLAQSQPGADINAKIDRDPRITKVGYWIRKLSIDELPQLFNVIKGDMSLVGPRPHEVREVVEYSLQQRRRLDVIPGITGLTQVSGRSNIDFDGQVRLDVEYIRSQSVWQDVVILLKTIPAVLLGKGAY